jgi:putative peptide zinc metalloprotease protein
VALTLATAVQKEMDTLLGLEDGEERRIGLQRLWAMHQARALGHAQEADRLQLTAPFAGTLLDVNQELAAGSWVASQTPLATLVDTTQWVAEAYVRQEDVERLPAGASVRFYPENRALAPLTGRVEAIDATRTHQLPHPMLSVQYGGPVAVVARENSLAPRDTLYRVRVVLDAPPRELQLQRGTAVIKGTPRSWLGEIIKPALTLLIRELTF